MAFAFNPVFFSSILLAYFVIQQTQIIGPLVNPIRHFFTAWGVAVAIYLWSKDPSFFKVPGIKLVPIFVLGALVTFLINISVNPARQFFSIFPILVALLVIYPLGVRLGKQPRPEKTWVKILGPAYLLILLQAVVSLGMALVAFQTHYHFMGRKWFAGMIVTTYGGNTLVALLYGVYRDPNFASLLLAFGISASALLLLKRDTLFTTLKTQKFVSALAIFSLVVELMVFSLAGSRGAKSAAFLAAVILAVVGIRYDRGRLSAWPKKLTNLLLRAVAAVLIVLAVTSGFQWLSNQYYSLPFIPNSDIHAYSELAIGEEEGSVIIGKGSFGSATRPLIWREVLTLWSHHPLFGVGPGTLKHYAWVEDIGGYQGNYFLKRNYISHNSYLELLVRYGLWGFLFYIAFAAVVFWAIAKALKGVYLDKEDLVMIFLWSFYMGALFFLTGLFTRFTFYYCVLLLLMGYFLAKPRKPLPTTPR